MHAHLLRTLLLLSALDNCSRHEEHFLLFNKASGSAQSEKKKKERKTPGSQVGSLCAVNPRPPKVDCCLDRKPTSAAQS